MQPRSHANANSRIAAALQVRVDPRLGGILLHGFGDTGDMWAPLVAVLVKGHTVIVPDLRGMGLSAHPNTGYTKKNQALDSAGVMDTFKVDRAALLLASTALGHRPKPDQDCVARPHTVSATQLPPLSSSVVKGLLQRCSRLCQCRTNGGGVADGVQEHEVVDRAVVSL